MAARLLLTLFFAVCLFNHVKSNCYIPPKGCSDGSYTAPPIVEVIKFGPSKIAKVTLNSANKALEVATKIGFGIFGEIGPGGSLIGDLFTGIKSLFGGKSDAERLKEVLEQIVEEIKNVRIYLDKRIEEAETRWLDNALGTLSSNTGLLGIAMKATYKRGPELLDQLDRLHDFLLKDFNQFVPQTDSIASYEKTLPLFRLFGDLYVSTVVSEINMFKQIGRHDYAAVKITELQSVVKKFQQHWSRACGKILADHLHLNNYHCKSFSRHTSWYIESCTTIDMGGLNCFIETSHCHYANPATYPNAKAFMIDARSTFVRNRRRNLLSYWKNQVGNIVQKWSMIGSKFATVQEAYVMSISDEEQKAFAVKQERIRQSVLNGQAYNYRAEITHDDPAVEAEDIPLARYPSKYKVQKVVAANDDIRQSMFEEKAYDFHPEYSQFDTDDHISRSQQPSMEVNYEAVADGERQWESYADPEYLSMKDSDQLVQDLKSMDTY